MRLDCPRLGRRTVFIGTGVGLIGVVVAACSATKSQPAASSQAVASPTVDATTPTTTILSAPSAQGHRQRRAGAARFRRDHRRRRTHTSRTGNVQRTISNLHPSGLHREQRGGRHNRLPLPRQQVQTRRFGRQRPGDAALADQVDFGPRRFDNSGRLILTIQTVSCPRGHPVS
jgi:hypothetical protein